MEAAVPSIACDALPGIDAKIAFLASSQAHEGAVRPVEVIETHMSWVFLSQTRVLKLKKPVRFPFLDFSTIDARAFYCREEVRLNSRLAPGIYTGVMALRWHEGRWRLMPGATAGADNDGTTVDWLVAMRRLPAERMLDRLIAAGQADIHQVDALAEVLANFYAQAIVLPVRFEEYMARLQREQAANREVLLRPQFALRDAGRALDRMDRALDRHEELLLERCVRSRIVDGHGDLRLEHVCMLDPPVVIDCLEFNPVLRQVDPFDELAFLALECEMAGATWIGERLLAACARSLDDHPPRTLIRLYTTLRSLMRARLAMAHLLDPTPRMPQKWAPLAQRLVDHALATLDDLDGFCLIGSRG